VISIKGSVKGQVSTELMVIIAAILVLFIPLLVITYFKTAEANEQIMQIQAQVIAIRLSELSNSVGSAGGSSAIIAEVFVPSSVTGISVLSSENGGEVTVHSQTQNGKNDISGLVKYDLQKAEFSFSSPGFARFEIYKDGDGVIILKKLQ